MLGVSGLRSSVRHQGRFVINREGHGIAIMSERVVNQFCFLCSFNRSSADKLSIVHSNILNFLLAGCPLQSVLLGRQTEHVVVSGSVI